MGVDYSAFLGIGRRFMSREEAEDFVAKSLLLSEGRIEELFDGGDYKGAEVVCLDHYNADDWFVGFRVGKTQEPEELSGDVMYAKNDWEEMFVNEPARVIWAVIYS